MEFVLTSTTPEASRKELVSSAEEISRIALEFATKVEDLKILWNVLQTESPEELLRAEPSAEFIKAVEAMKQMLQESLAVSQLPKQSARLSSACADSKEAVKLSTGKPVSVKSEPGTGEPSLEFTSIFVGGIPMAMTEDQLRVVLGAKGKARIIERYHKKAKVGHAKVHWHQPDGSVW